MNDYVTSVMYFPGAFSARECLSIRDLPLVRATDVGVYPEPAIPMRKAESYVVPIESSTAWVASRLTQFAREANERFQVALSEEIRPVLRVRYRVGDFFDWHSDLGDGAESTRKLSLSLHLTQPEDFAGGQFRFIGCSKEIPAPEAGTLFVFPSHFAHQITPVTRGSREALVAWIHGPPFT